MSWFKKEKKEEDKFKSIVLTHGRALETKLYIDGKRIENVDDFVTVTPMGTGELVTIDLTPNPKEEVER